MSARTNAEMLDALDDLRSRHDGWKAGKRAAYDFCFAWEIAYEWVEKLAREGLAARIGRDIDKARLEYAREVDSIRKAFSEVNQHESHERMRIAREKFHRALCGET